MGDSLLFGVLEVDFPIVTIDEGTLAFPVGLVAVTFDKVLQLRSARYVRISEHFNMSDQVVLYSYSQVG